jgi:GNAT superfamily N-acetyltransferase
MTRGPSGTLKSIMSHAAPTVEEFYRAMGRMVVRFYGRTPGSSCVLASHAILGCSGLGSIFLNCGVVFGDGPAGDDPAEDRMREFVARIRERRVGGYVCLSETIQRRLEPLARELGLEPLPPIPLMAHVPAGRPADAGEPPDTPGDEGGPVVERVAGPEGLADFLALSEMAFDLPSGLYGRVVTAEFLKDPLLSVYLSRLDGVAVAGAIVVDDEGLAGISGMATLPDLQGRGIGGSLLEHVLNAHAAHTRAFYLTASEAGQRLYRRHGFDTVDAATAWVVPPPAASGGTV